MTKIPDELKAEIREMCLNALREDWSIEEMREAWNIIKTKLESL